MVLRLEPGKQIAAYVDGEREYCVDELVDAENLSERLFLPPGEWEYIEIDCELRVHVGGNGRKKIEYWGTKEVRYAYSGIKNGGNTVYTERFGDNRGSKEGRMHV